MGKKTYWGKWPQSVECPFEIYGKNIKGSQRRQVYGHLQPCSGKAWSGKIVPGQEVARQKQRGRGARGRVFAREKLSEGTWNLR